MNSINIKYLLPLILITSIIFSCAGGKKQDLAKNKLLQKSDAPGWVTEHPISKLYYIGIGVVAKSPDSQEHIQMAKDAALNDLASQIAVNISGETYQTVIERSGMIEDEFKSHIHTSTKAELEGYELVDTWEDYSSYWVYYRLSKGQYALNKQEKIDRAVRLSLDLFTKAKNSERQNDISGALQFYLQALNPIEKYIAQTLEVDFEGLRIYLFNEIYSSIQNLLSKIELKPTSSKMEAKIGQPLKISLEVAAVYKAADGDEFGISNLPLSFAFTRGSGDLVEKARTDQQGIAKCRISKIKAFDAIQIIQVKLDISGMIALDEASPIIKGIVNSFTIPSEQIELSVSNITAYIKSSETHMGYQLDIPAIEPAFKDALSYYGFSFIDNKNTADYIITIEAQSKQGSEIMGEMYSSFVNFSVLVYDRNKGEELYKQSLHDIKGIDLNFDKAGLKAYKNAGQRVRDEIVSDLLAAIKR